MLKKNFDDTTHALSNHENTHLGLDKPSKRGKKTSIEKRDFDVHVGKRFHSLRQVNGDSQELAGEHIDVTFQQVQKYEKGFNGLSLYRAYQISKFYNVPISYLTDGFDDSSIAGEGHNALPMENRGCTKMAHLFNELPNPRVQKAILAVLHSLVPEKPEAT